MNLQPGVTADAYLSPCETYRYSLTRVWDSEGSNALWIMLNPSVATAEVDDPTVRRTQSFSRGWDYGSVTVANIFALRATNPKELYGHPDPKGPENDRTIFSLAAAADLIVVAWGGHGSYLGRGAQIAEMLCDFELWCLGTTIAGEPRHPLYVLGSARLERWKPIRSTGAQCYLADRLKDPEYQKAYDAARESINRD